MWYDFFAVWSWQLSELIIFWWKLMWFDRIYSLPISDYRMMVCPQTTQTVCEYLLIADRSNTYIQNCFTSIGSQVYLHVKKSQNYVDDVYRIREYNVLNMKMYFSVNNSCENKWVKILEMYEKTSKSIEHSSPLYQTYTPNVIFESVGRKLDHHTHTGSKGFIHSPKRGKENQLLSL